MLPLLLLLVVSQAPAVPGEGTLVSFCKQRWLTACEELARVNPEKAAEIQKESHCGYQEWHRQVDAEVIKWLKNQEKATPEQFMKMLRDIYNRPEMLKRFPNGF